MADNDLERALLNIKELHDNFDGVHPVETQTIEVMAQGLMAVKDLLREFWAICWGQCPESLDGYRD
jgi:hypothetical protein